MPTGCGPKKLFIITISASPSNPAILNVAHGLVCIGPFASGGPLRDNSRRLKTQMPAPANLFGVLTEFIVLLLGALLFVIGASGNYGVAERPTALVVLGIALIYWGVRSAMKRTPKQNRTLVHVRSSALIVVGLSVLTIAVVPREAGILLGLAGTVLVIRGLLGAVLYLRAS